MAQSTLLDARYARISSMGWFKLSWLDRYWVISIPVYPGAVLGLGLALRPPWSDTSEWANIVTLAFGMAAGLGVSAGVVVTMILAIPGRIGRIKQEGKDERDREWVAWQKAKDEAERQGQPFMQPSPAERDALAKSNR